MGSIAPAAPPASIGLSQVGTLASSGANAVAPLKMGAVALAAAPKPPISPAKLPNVEIGPVCSLIPLSIDKRALAGSPYPANSAIPATGLATPIAARIGAPTTSVIRLAAV